MYKSITLSEPLLDAIPNLPKPAQKILIHLIKVYKPGERFVPLTWKSYTDATKDKIHRSDFSKATKALVEVNLLEAIEGVHGVFHVNKYMFQTSSTQQQGVMQVMDRDL